jgi:predicted Zn-dependent peptidase
VASCCELMFALHRFFRTCAALHCIERLPIGLMSVIKNVTPDTVRKFYSTHYHPQLMAVIAVGHFQQPLSEVVATLQRIFEASPKRIDDAQLPHRPQIVVPKEQHPVISVFVDKVRRNVTATTAA